MQKNTYLEVSTESLLKKKKQNEKDNYTFVAYLGI